VNTLFFRFFMVVALAYAISAAMQAKAGPVPPAGAKQVQGVPVPQLDASRMAFALVRR
jgi:hypothetical protein